ncbi:MAG TPA: NAD/NADP octopine/nopaline dehydrogenase family protein [Synergistales bacterium]|nr:NAD/NADP octopine/nopaline dehydrogenase family protein [Synergistales bacterium]
MGKVIAILGGGNAGQASAAELTLLGHECRLYQDPRFAEDLRLVLETGKIRLEADPKGGCRATGLAAISKASCDMAETVRGAEIILCHLPAFAHADVAEQLADLVEDGQVIVLLPGTLGTLVFVETFKRKGVAADVLIAETNTNSYDTRVLGPGQAYVYKMNDPLQIGVFPSSRTAEALEKLDGVYAFVPVSDILEAAFHSHNPVIHTPACIMSVSRIERSRGDFYLYEEAFTQTVCRVTKMLDEERMAVARAFGYAPLTLEQLLSGLEQPGDLFKETNGNPGLCFIRGPESVKSRYFTEDGLNGLVPWSQLARTAGIPVPLMEAFATIEGAVIERDMWREGRTLKTLGLEGMNVTEIRKYLREGKKTGA